MKGFDGSFLPRWITPIIKITGDYCNLRCRYCFYHTLDQQTPTVMPDTVLESLIEKVMAYGDPKIPAHFIWHGGEPLLAGIDVFQRIVEIEQRASDKYGREVRNSVQTNGVLIAEEWAKWFASHNFQVGVSIDGSQSIHDEVRVNAGGQGSWQVAIRGIKLLMRYGVKTGALMVVHGKNWWRAREAIEALREEGIQSIGFNPYFEPDIFRDHRKNREWFLTPERFAHFLKEAFEVWVEMDDATFRLREIDNFVAMVGRVVPSSCSFRGSCGNHISIHYNGDVYPCERIPRQPSLYFGNIVKQSLEEILLSEVRKRFLQRVEYWPEECVECPLEPYCNNGCTHHRVDGHYYYCSTRKEVFAYVKDKIGAQITFLKSNFEEQEVQNEKQ